MSKPAGSKPRASEPARLPSNPPPNSRKASSGPTGARSSSKFYDGPTVPKSAVEAKAQAKDIAGRTVEVAKSKSRKAVRVAKRHPWSILSILTTLPFLLTISLFSTVLCPAPDTQPSGLSRFVQSRLGMYDGPSELRQTLCYPANRYHQQILQPYVYPALENARTRVEATYPYTEFIQPGYTFSRDRGTKFYNTFISPVVRRLERGGRRVYLTQVQPHLPWARTKWYTLTAPFSDRISAAHQQYLAPHLSTARKYASLAGGNAASSYRYAAAHPLTHLSRRYAQTTYALGLKKGGDAYVWSRPHAIRLVKQAEKVTREQVIPRVTAALKFVVDHLEEGFYVVKAQVAQQYKIHLDPHLHPYTSKASAALSPYTTAFNQKIYKPYLRQYVNYLVPAALLAPEPPKSFWTMISDFLPSPGSHAAQRKGSMTEKVRQAATGVKSDVRDKSKVARESAAKVSAAAKEKASSASAVAAKSASSAASVASRSASSVSAAAKSQASSASSAGKQVVEEVTSAAKSATASASASVSSASRSASASVGEKGKMTKAEFDTARDGIAARLEAQGKASIEKLKQELTGVQTKFLADTYPKMADTNKKELTKEVDYILSGLDKLYSESGALTREQVKQSGIMAEQRLSTKLATIKGRGGEVARVTKDQGKPAMRREMDAVDAVLGKEWTDLAMKIAWIDGITAKDRQKFNDLRKTADDYKSRLSNLHDGKVHDKTLSAAESKLSASIKELATELDDLYAGYKERVKILQKSAVDKIAAREMIRGSQVAASAAKSSAHTANGERATILPIIPGAVAADAPVDGVIGKGKEQVMQALSQASSAMKGEASSSGVAEQVVASASSVYDAAASSVHDATRSASRAVGAVPTPESVNEHVESVVGQVSQVAGSAYDAAASVIHDATRSAVRSVGATPSPVSPVEHAQSIRDAAARSAQSAASAASSAVHHATRSAMSAVGIAPSAENLQETAESVYSVASQSASSVVSVASQSASSVVSVAGDSAHEATEAIKAALNNLHIATESIKSTGPLPTVNEYLASIANDVAAGAASVYGIVEENVHQATRSVISAAGATPSPENPAEYAQSYAGEISKTAESLASVISASASSIASAASASAVSLGSGAGASADSVRSAVQSAVHDATRSAIRAAGSTPSPEGVQEHYEAYAAVAAEKLGKLMEEVKGSVGSVAGAAESAVHSGTRAIVKAAGATPSPESPRETLESVAAAASASASSVYDAAASAGDNAVSQAALLASSIQSALGYQATPIPTPVASSASAYLASLSSAGVSVGNEALSSGSSILAALQSQVAVGQGEAGKKVKEAVEQVRGVVGGRVEL